MLPQHSSTPPADVTTATNGCCCRLAQHQEPLPAAMARTSFLAVLA